MGCDPRLVAHDLNCFYAVQQALARRPEFYFIDEPKKLHPFAVVSFDRRPAWRFFSHSFEISIQPKLIGSRFRVPRFQAMEFAYNIDKESRYQIGLSGELSAMS